MPGAAASNPLLELTRLGQSVWIDYLDRNRIKSGEIRRYIEEDGLRGMTSNPTIFEKAIIGAAAYEEPVRALAALGKSAADIYESIVTRDVQIAADELRGVFDQLDGRDGFVSLEVSPLLAFDTDGTLAEARRLWAAVNRPNLMIKVPATTAGIPAIARLIDDGINVNVTLLFGLERYQEVADAYLSGLEARASRGETVRIASVASFFLSRIDVMVDAKLDELEKAGQVAPFVAERLRGQTAIASARTAFQMYKRTFRGGVRFQALAAKGARPQRLLWASTSTKNPAYSDVKYVEALIGEDTINTVPLETFTAYRDHGRPARRIEEDLGATQAVLHGLGDVGIELGAVTAQLEQDGVRKFSDSYAHVLRAIEQRRAAV
ncbi:MAG TPA: transaldolase [Polyangia bacterium]|nr:transaldolase [Polyangia bacterium]